MKTASELIDQLYEAKSLGYTDKNLEDAIFKFMSQDEKIIPSLLAILSHERQKNKEFLSETLVALSMGMAGMEAAECKDLLETSKLHVKMFYKKHEDKIQCGFKIPGLK